MEQKQLDEMEQSFLDEEFISEEDLVAEPKKGSQSSPPAAEPSADRKSPSTSTKNAIRITPVKAAKLEKKEVEKKETRSEKKVQVHEMHPEPKSKALLKLETFSSPLSKEPAVKKESKEPSGTEASLPGKEKDSKPSKPAEKSASSPSSFSSSPPVNPWANENGSGTLKSVSTWKAMTGIVLVLLLFSVFTDGFQFGGEQPAAKAVLPQDEAVQKALAFVNENLLRPPFVAEVTASADMGDLYKVTLAVAGQEVESYITKDGGLFFPQGISLSAPLGDTEKDADTVNAAGTDIGDADEPQEEDSAAAGEEADVSDSSDGLSGAAVVAAESTGSGVTTDGEPFLGEENAPVTIVEFSDYQCPFCRNFWSDILPQLKEGYIATGMVRFMFKDFPLQGHPEAKPAALAAACAGEQDRFWEYHDELFAGQRSLGDEQYEAWAEDLGLDLQQFTSCVSSKKYEEEIRADIQEAADLGILGTPAFVINGKIISGFQPYSVFVREVEAALAAQDAGQGPELAAEEPTEEASPEAAPAATETSAPPADEDSQDVILMAMTAKKWLFSPNKLVVRQGDEVQLAIVPEGGLQFTFSIPALEVETEVSGKTVVSFVADKVGEFPFSCSSCESWRGMTGKVVVQVD